MEKGYVIKKEYKHLFNADIANAIEHLQYFTSQGILLNALEVFKDFTNATVKCESIYKPTKNNAKFYLELDIKGISSKLFSYLHSDVKNVIKFLNKNFNE